MKKQSYRPVYHASVPAGWANDPNGTIFYGGKAHLFYQHYPYKPEWGTMHWGHFVTEDFVKWENLPVALVPDQDYEVICGCCSGSAAEKDGKLWLMYTAAQPELQRQCVAVSPDGGVSFEKDPGNPILTADMLDPEVYEMDFRDPRLFRKDGSWYLVAGVRVLDAAEQEEESRRRAEASEKRAEASGNDTAAHGYSSGQDSVRSPSAGDVSGTDTEKPGYGNLILARSADLLHWEYTGHLLQEDTPGQIPMGHEYFTLNGVYECPDYFVVDGAEVLLSSPQNLPQMGNLYQNIHSALYMLGKLDFKNGRVTVGKVGELDAGFDFYAAQTLRMPDGRQIMIAWKEMWDRSYPTQKEGWAGTYTLPRELRVIDGALVQLPVREIEGFRADRRAVPEFTVGAGKERSFPEIFGTAAELSVTLEPGSAEKAGVKLFCGKEHETLIYYDRAEDVLVFDRSKSGLPLKGREDEVNVRKVDLSPVDAAGQSSAKKSGRKSIQLRMFLDICSVEVFIDGGRHVMTGNVYPDLETDSGIRFFSEGGSCTFRDLEKFDIRVE